MSVFINHRDRPGVRHTVTLTEAMQSPAASAHGNTSSYALSTFVGLIVFGLFAELCSRAPLLMHEHAWFLKTSIDVI